LRTFFLILLFSVLAVAGWLAWALVPPVSPAGQVFVMLRPGYSVHRIATELKRAGVIRSADAFILWHYAHRHHSLKAGEYLFDKPDTAIHIHKRLVRGDIYVHTVVIPEGYNMFEIAQAIQNAGLGSGQDFLKAAESDTSLVSDLDPGAKSLEGFLFPNTYEFTRTQTMDDMVAEMVRQFRQVAQEIGLNTNIEPTVIMASIVEKETAVPEERPLVASVYYNRLEKHMPLQADPSVIYAEMRQGDYSGALHHDDMQFDSAYNTYTHIGLPPGPIGNPGKSSLEAAMHPAKTEYLYFVSDGNDHHRFAKTLAEHNRNVAAYRKIMEQR
jgi:peptidoglycan lytic transglycosylase G